MRFLAVESIPIFLVLGGIENRPANFHGLLLCKRRLRSDVGDPEGEADNYHRRFHLQANSGLNNDQAKADNPATRKFYQFLDRLTAKKG